MLAVIVEADAAVLWYVVCRGRSALISTYVVAGAGLQGIRALDMTHIRCSTRSQKRVCRTDQLSRQHIGS